MAEQVRMLLTAKEVAAELEVGTTTFHEKLKRHLEEVRKWPGARPQYRYEQVLQLKRKMDMGELCQEDDNSHHSNRRQKDQDLSFGKAGKTTITSTTRSGVQKPGNKSAFEDALLLVT